MAKYAKKPNKVRVARYATPDKVISVTPITERYLGMSTAKEVLDCRHNELKSWRVLAYELAEPHATLSAIVKRNRRPTDKLIKKLNNTYGCHLVCVPRAVTVTPCAVCGSTRHTRHRTRRPDPVIRLKRLRAVLDSPYRMS